MGILDHPSSSGSQPGQPRGIGSGTNSGTFGIEWSKWFPPVTSRTFLSHYLPASGAISHTLYTVHLFSPNIISSLFPTGDLAVSNTILFNANVGLGFYVYFRRHLHRVNPWERVEFSVLSSTLFNFGSLLAAVLIKALFPLKSPTWLKSLTATVLSGYLLSRAAKYMGLLDTRTSSRGSVSPARSVLSQKTRHTAARLLPEHPNARAIATSSSSEDALHLDTTSSHLENLETMSPHLDTLLETPPRSNEANSFLPMTPSATEHTTSEFGRDSEDVELQNLGGSAHNQNYRYLHSFALNNLNHARPKKETILRRTTMNQIQNPGILKIQNPMTSPEKLRRTSDAMAPLCFVTPEPSLMSLEAGIYTPPPSRTDSRVEATPTATSHAHKKSIKSQKSRKSHKSSKMPNEKDEFDRILDLLQWHAPLMIVPVAFGCWMTGTTVPIVSSTIRFIFF